MMASDIALDNLAALRDADDPSVIVGMRDEARRMIADILDAADYEVASHATAADDGYGSELLARMHAIGVAVDSRRDYADRDAVLNDARCAAYGSEMTGGGIPFRTMLVDTLGWDGYEDLTPAHPIRDAARHGMWSRYVCLHGTDDKGAAVLLFDGSVPTADVYGEFMRLFDDPARTMLRCGGFETAALIVFASRHAPMRRLHMKRDDFIRTAVAAASDSRDELEWLLDLANRCTEKGLYLATSPDIGYVRTNHRLASDFVVESAKVNGMISLSDYEAKYAGLEYLGWKGIAGDFGMQTGDECYDGWGYSALSAGMRAMDALGCMPEGFQRLPDVIFCDSGDLERRRAGANETAQWFAVTPESPAPDDYRTFSYHVRIMGHPKCTGHGQALKTLAWMGDSGDPGMLYRWMISILEQNLSYAALATYMMAVVPSGTSSDIPLRKGVARFIVGCGNGADDDEIRRIIAGEGPGHTNNRPPAEALEYVRTGRWPRTFTYGDDVLMIPNAIQRAFASLVPDEWEDLADESYTESSDGSTATLLSRIMDDKRVRKAIWGDTHSMVWL